MCLVQLSLRLFNLSSNCWKTSRPSPVITGTRKKSQSLRRKHIQKDCSYGGHVHFFSAYKRSVGLCVSRLNQVCQFLGTSASGVGVAGITSRLLLLDTSERDTYREGDYFSPRLLSNQRMCASTHTQRIQYYSIVSTRTIRYPFLNIIYIYFLYHQM